MLTNRIWHVLTLLALTLPSTALAQSGVAALGGIDQLRPGRTMRASSSDTNDWKDGNADMRSIAPGETITLADLDGPGRVTHIWNTIASEEEHVSKLVVVRMYWDGEKEPSVEAPLGDFFVIGHGVDRPMQSLPVMVSSEGRARNCYWPMPFGKHAKITVTNEGKKPVGAFYWYVDWQKLPSLPEDTPYFHASYRQEYPTSGDADYRIADIEGRGHYVGTVLNVRQRSGGWFGEGDDFFYIDGEATPSLRGTGTEDYFCDAWGFREFAGPYYGVPVFGHYQPRGLITAYRWHLADPVNFQESLRVEIEHKGAVFAADGTVSSGYGPRTEDFASVAYWYQLEPHKPFPALPPAAERLYPDIDARVEAEDAVDSSLVSRGDLSVQEGERWSNNAQLLWRPTEPEQTLKIPFTIDRAGDYVVEVQTTLSWDYGTYDVLIDGEKKIEALDLYSKSIDRKRHMLATTRLEPGEHHLTFRNAGKSPDSEGYFLGVDAIAIIAK